MSLLSERLSELIDAREMTTAQLGKICNIDNSTLRQYLNGKRPMRNFQILEKIIYPLCLTASEYQEVVEYFDIEQDGKQMFQQRKATSRFFNNLTNIKKDSNVVKPENSYKNDDIYSLNFIDGELDIKNTIIKIFSDSINDETDVNLMINPQCDINLSTLLMLFGKSKSVVNDFICFDKDLTKSKYYNLDSADNIVKSFFSSESYNPYCYYGDISERFSESSFCPNIICTDKVVMLFSNDKKNAILHTDNKIVEYYHKQFTNLKLKSRTVASYQNDFNGQMGNMRDFMSNINYDNVYELTNGFCSVQFFNFEIANKYIAQYIPNREKIVQEYTDYATHIYQKKSKGHTTLLMNKSYMEQFVEDGILHEYSGSIFRMPLDHKDRLFLLENLFIAYKKGWYDIRFLKENEFPYDYLWETVVTEKNDMVLRHISQDKINVFNFTEPILSQAIYNYLEYLSNSRFVYTKDECENILANMLRKLGKII